MIKKKNSFWTFCFSFIPGAAEMYMGFMKMGVSLLTAFLTLCAIATLIDVAPVLFFALGVWIFSFFHARNLAALTEEELKLIKDRYIFTDEQELFTSICKNHNHLLAILLIFCGAALLWDYISDLAFFLLPNSIYNLYSHIIYRIPKVALAVLIIFIGLKLLKKEDAAK